MPVAFGYCYSVPLLLNIRLEGKRSLAHRDILSETGVINRI